jgi:glycosyltransferase involved in cell wall biosynthesis
MMGSIILYAPEGPPVEGATLVPCLSDAERQDIFGKDDIRRLPAWPTEEQSQSFHVAVIKEMRKRIQPQDLILLTGGWTQHVVKAAFPNNICCEPGVGYEGWFTNYCAFESYAWMHYTYGKKDIKDGRWYDTVIPNYFDPADFTHKKGRAEYLLYVGRVIARKGVHIASQIAKAVDMPLFVAGAGGRQEGNDVVSEETRVENATYVGPLTIEGRSQWMTQAYALLVPTTYIEPFGGVAVEAMMCGTPVVTTDWGAFSETVKNGVSGFRFRTLKEGIAAVRECRWLDEEKIKSYALDNYSLDAVAPQFERWFGQLNDLWKKGWYEV